MKIDKFEEARKTHQRFKNNESELKMTLDVLETITDEDIKNDVRYGRIGETPHKEINLTAVQFKYILEYLKEDFAARIKKSKEAYEAL